MNPLEVDWPADRTRVLLRLREWSAAAEATTRHLAAFLDLPVADAHALGVIVWAAQEGAPASPVVLSRRIGMTSGATTALLNRLEAAGHVTRSREHDDRRRVTLRPAPDTVRRFSAFLDTAGDEVAAVLLAADDGDLRRVEAFLRRLVQAAEDANARLAAVR